MNTQPRASLISPEHDALYKLREEVRTLHEAISGYQDTCIQLQQHVQHLIDKDAAREREIKALSAIILRDEAMQLVLDYAPQLKKRLLGLQNINNQPKKN